MSLDDLDELASLVEDCRPLFDALPWSRSKLASNLDCIILKAVQLRDGQQNSVQEQVCDYGWYSFYCLNASQLLDTQQKRVYEQVGRSHVWYRLPSGNFCSHRMQRRVRKKESDSEVGYIQRKSCLIAP